MKQRFIAEEDRLFDIKNQEGFEMTNEHSTLLKQEEQQMLLYEVDWLAIIFNTVPSSPTGHNKEIMRETGRHRLHVHIFLIFNVGTNSTSQ